MAYVSKMTEHRAGSRVIGDQEFVKTILARDKQRKIRLSRHCAEQITLDDVAELAGAAMSVSTQELRRRSRGS